jgi:hypothetical protein
MEDRHGNMKAMNRGWCRKTKNIRKRVLKKQERDLSEAAEIRLCKVNVRCIPLQSSGTH